MTQMVKLTPTEVDLVKRIARYRRVINDRNGAVEKKQGKQSSEEMEEQGYLGEYAVCKHLNAFWSLASESRSGGEDLILSKKTIDVKTIKAEKNRVNLVVQEDKAQKPCDVYILVKQHKEDEYEIIGYCLAADIFKEENKQPNYSGYWVHESKLKSL